MSEIDGFYPLHVRETRYDGAYAHGRYALFAGIHDPNETDAFATDTKCNKYWQAIREEGPVMQYNPEPDNDNPYMVLAGDDPAALVERAKGIAQGWNQR